MNDNQNDKLTNKDKEDISKVEIDTNSPTIEYSESSPTIESSPPTTEDIPFILEQILIFQHQNLITQQKICEMMEESQRRESEQKTNLEKFIQYQSKRDEDIKGKDAIDLGEIKTRRFKNYYDRSFTIPVATASDPNDFDSSSYTGESKLINSGVNVAIVEIYEELQRYSDRITVKNDDDIASLFAIVSHGGKTNFGREAEILPGESKDYYNVYELRFRSPTAGLHYRVMEYDLCCATSAQSARFGRNIVVSWIYGSKTTAPGAGTTLVTKTVTAGKSGYIYGFWIAAQEANDFNINWTSGGVAQILFVPFGGNGMAEDELFVALNEGFPADAGTAVFVNNVNAAGAGKIYQVSILYGEV